MQESRREPERTGAQRSKRLHVLVADDNEVNRQLVSHLLVKLGCSVELATNGREAVEQCQCQDFDLVLMDVQMPEMDGLEACELIRAKQLGPARRAPIYALSANVTDAYRQGCLAAGMDGFLAKPLHVAELSTVLELVGSKRLGEQAELDINVGLEQLGGDRELFRELAQMFSTESKIVLSEIKRAMASGNGGAMSRAAHRLKGSAAIFGATQAVNLAQRLEQSGQSDELEGTEALLSQLEDAVECLIPALVQAGEGIHEASGCR